MAQSTGKFKCCVVFPLPQTKRSGAGDQGHHVGPPAARAADLADAPQPTDPHPGRRPHAPASPAGALHQPGRWALPSAWTTTPFKNVTRK